MIFGKMLMSRQGVRCSSTPLHSCQFDVQSCCMCNDSTKREEPRSLYLQALLVPEKCHICIYRSIFIDISLERERDLHAYMLTFVYTYMHIYICVFVCVRGSDQI